MSRYEDIDEELRRILDDGSASAQPAELADFQAQLAQQPDTSGDMPRGTKVAFDDVPEVAAPVRMPLVPREPALPAEKVVDVSQQPPDDLEMAYASAQDRKSRSAEARERGGRQLIAGLTRTPVVESTPGPVDAVSKLMAMRKDREGIAQHNEQNRLGAAKLSYDTREGARKAAVDEQRRNEDLQGRAADDARADKGLALSADSTAATREQTKAMFAANYGLSRDAAKAKEQDRGDRIAAGTIPLFNGSLQTPPGLSDTERNRAREQAGLWNAADEATGQLEDALQSYVANPGAETAQNITALLGGASTALNTAYGQGAMAEAEAKRMADTLGADIRSLGGMKALFDRAMGNPEAGKLLMTKIKTARAGNRAVALARLRTSGRFAQGSEDAQPAAPGRQTATLADGSKVRLSADGKSWEPM